jgi:methylthioribose-1-phosphate isomerase
LGRVTAPPETTCLNPAFDVTPAELVRGIITEHGIIEPVSAENIRRVLGR